MSKIVEFTCPTCGDVRVRPNEVRITPPRDDSGLYVALVSCPTCEKDFVKPLRPRTYEMLVDAGAALQQSPARLTEHEVEQFADALADLDGEELTRLLTADD